MPRQDSLAGGQEGLIDSAELRSSDLAGEHLHLVPKDDDLDLQFAIRARMTGPDHAAERRVEKSEQHDRGMLHRRWSGRRIKENVPFSLEEDCAGRLGACKVPHAAVVGWRLQHWHAQCDVKILKGALIRIRSMTSRFP